MTTEELVAKLDALTAQTNKVGAEVQNLISIIQNQGNVSPEVEAAINSLSSAIQGVDDLNADS